MSLNRFISLVNFRGWWKTAAVNKQCWYTMYFFQLPSTFTWRWNLWHLSQTPSKYACLVVGSHDVFGQQILMGGKWISHSMNAVYFYFIEIRWHFGLDHTVEEGAIYRSPERTRFNTHWMESWDPRIQHNWSIIQQNRKLRVRLIQNRSFVCVSMHPRWPSHRPQSRDALPRTYVRGARESSENMGGAHRPQNYPPTTHPLPYCGPAGLLSTGDMLLPLPLSRSSLQNSFSTPPFMPYFT